MERVYKIHAVDFDGCLVSNKYPEIGKPNEKLFKALIDVQADGDIVILWTCRCGERLEEAVRFCALQGLKFDYINENTAGINESFGSDCRKIFADYYYDDKAVCVQMEDE